MAKKPSAIARRSAARLAAVQALYQMMQTGADADVVIAEFSRHRFGEEIDGEVLVTPDPELFRAIVRGVEDHEGALDAAIHPALTGGWASGRMEAILRCILRAGAWELIERAETPIGIVIADFVSVGQAFFGGKEPAMVNAVLDQIARRVRNPDGGGPSLEATLG